MAYPQAILCSELLERAEEFLWTYHQAPPKPPWPRYFLLCGAVELVLKAYLALHRGLTQAELQNFRHDLIRLLCEAIKSGLKISPLAQSEIARLDEPHKKHWPRYPKEGVTRVLPISQFEPAVEELFKAVRQAR
jgi:hypothetical protein